MHYWTWCRGECFTSSNFCPSLSARCSVRHVEWTHRNRHQSTARCVWVWSVWVLLFILPSVKVQTYFLILKVRIVLLCSPSWPNSPPSCLNFLNVRVTDMCHFSQLTFVFHLSYFCVYNIFILINEYASIYHWPSYYTFMFNEISFLYLLWFCPLFYRHLIQIPWVIGSPEHQILHLHRSTW